MHILVHDAPSSSSEEIGGFLRFERSRKSLLLVPKVVFLDWVAMGSLTRASSATCTFSHAQKSPRNPTCGGTDARYTDLRYVYWFWVGVHSCVCPKLVPTENPIIQD